MCLCMEKKCKNIGLENCATLKRNDVRCLTQNETMCKNCNMSQVVKEYRSCLTIRLKCNLRLLRALGLKTWTYNSRQLPFLACFLMKSNILINSRSNTLLLGLKIIDWFMSASCEQRLCQLMFHVCRVHSINIVVLVLRGDNCMLLAHRP